MALHQGLLARELGLSVGGRRSGQGVLWGRGPASEGLVRKLALDWSSECRDASVVNDVSWDSSGTFLAAGGDDAALRVFDTAGRLLREFDSGHTGSVLALQYMPGSGGARMMTGGSDKQVRVIDVTRGAVKPFSCNEARVRCLAAVDGSVMLSGADDGGVRLFDVRQSQAPTLQLQDLRSLVVNQRSEPGRSGARVCVNTIAVDPLRQHMFATGSTDPVVRLYDMRMLPRPAPGAGMSCPPVWAAAYAPHHLRARALSGAPYGSSARLHLVSGVAFDPIGSRLAASYAHEAVYCFGLREHAASFEQLREPAAQRGGASAAAAARRAAAGSPAPLQQQRSQAGVAGGSGGGGGDADRGASAAGGAADASRAGRRRTLRAVRRGAGSSAASAERQASPGAPGASGNQEGGAPAVPLATLLPGANGAPDMMALPNGLVLPAPQLPPHMAGNYTSVTINVIDTNGDVHRHEFMLPPRPQAARGRSAARAGRNGARGRGRGSRRGGQQGVQRSGASAGGALGDGAAGDGSATGGGSGSSGLGSFAAALQGLGDSLMMVRGGQRSGSAPLTARAATPAAAPAAATRRDPGGGDSAAATAGSGGLAGSLRQFLQSLGSPPGTGRDSAGAAPQADTAAPGRLPAPLLPLPLPLPLGGLSLFRGGSTPRGPAQQAPDLGQHAAPRAPAAAGGHSSGGGNTGAAAAVLLQRSALGGLFPFGGLSLPFGAAANSSSTVMPAAAVPRAPLGSQPASATDVTTHAGGNGGGRDASISAGAAGGGVVQRTSSGGLSGLLALVRQASGVLSGGRQRAEQQGSGAAAGGAPGPGGEAALAQHRPPKRARLRAQPPFGMGTDGAAAAGAASRGAPGPALERDGRGRRHQRALASSSDPECDEGGAGASPYCAPASPVARRTRRRATGAVTAGAGRAGRLREASGPVLKAEAGTDEAAAGAERRSLRTPRHAFGPPQGAAHLASAGEQAALVSSGALPGPRPRMTRAAAARAEGRTAAGDSSVPAAAHAGEGGSVRGRKRRTSGEPGGAASDARAAPQAATDPTTQRQQQQPLTARGSASASARGGGPPDSGAGGLSSSDEDAGSSGSSSDSDSDDDAARRLSDMLPSTYLQGARGPRSRRGPRVGSVAAGAVGGQAALGGFLFACYGHRHQVSLKNVTWLGGGAAGPGGGFLASGSDDGSVFVWSGADGRMVNVLRGGDRPVICVEAHPTQPLLASCSAPTVSVWSPSGSPPTDLSHAPAIVAANVAAAAAADAAARARAQLGLGGLGMGGGANGTLDALISQGIAAAFGMLANMLPDGGARGGASSGAAGDGGIDDGAGPGE